MSGLWSSKERMILKGVKVLLSQSGCALLVCTLCLATNWTSPKVQNRGSASLPHPEFRYVIVQNYPLHGGRLVTVLMDPKSFSETNLRQLFKLLGKRYPKPEELHVGVYTSLEQLPTPEEEDYAKEVPNAPLLFLAQVDKYPGASYTRAKGSQGFQYSLGDGQPERTVIISGKDPFK